jgi:ATP-binding cassette, subfamily B, bacterial
VSGSAWSKLQDRFGSLEARLFPWFLGTIGGLLVPATVLLVGWAVELLSYAQFQQPIPLGLKLGPYLQLPLRWLDWSNSVLGKVAILLAVILIFSLLIALLLLIAYRWSIGYAIDLEMRLRRELFQAHRAKSEFTSENGNATQLSEAQFTWIPTIRDAVMNYYRQFPRYSVQFILCFCLAFLIQPILSLLTLFASLLMWRLYRYLEYKRWLARPVYVDRSRAALDVLSTMTKRGPLLTLIHPLPAVQANLESQLSGLRHAESELQVSFVWKSPLLVALVALLATAFCFVLSIHILTPDSGINVASALTLVGLTAFGYLAIVRLVKARELLRSTETMTQRLLSYIEPSPKATKTTRLQNAEPLQASLELHEVSFDDPQGHPILQEINLVAKPSSLIAVVSTSDRESRALGELIVQLHSPSKGRLLWDAIPCSSLTTESLAKHCQWIDSTGPIIAGTLFENLSPGNPHRPLVDLVEATRMAGVYEAIVEFPDAFSTLLSNDDDRLKSEQLFRVGIARAMLSKVQVVVAEEALVSAHEANIHLAALKQLKALGAMIFILPKSTLALREADHILLLEHGRIAAQGNHRELLINNETYRHLNYVLFNALRNDSTED